MKRRKSIKCLIAMFIMVMAFSVMGITAKAANVTQTTQTQNSITVNWVAQEKAVEYYVRIGIDSTTAKSAQPIVVPANQTSYTFNNLAAGTEYTIYVEYKYISSYSREYTSTIGSIYSACTLPSKVTGVNQTKWWYFVKSVDFAWDDQSAAKYEYIIKNENNKKIAENTSSSNEGSLSKVSNNMVYKVQVRAYVTINSVNYYGDYSDVAYLFTQPMVKTAKVSGNKLKISWNKVKGISSYEVYVSTKEKTGYKKVKTVGKSKTSITVSKLKGKKFSPKKKYYIYIVGNKKVNGKKYTSGRHYTFDTKQKDIHWTFD